MKIKAASLNTSSHKLSGNISVPGSKSHTVRACLFAALGNGVSHIKNPLPSEDCISASNAIKEFGAKVERGDGVWTITGAGDNFHLPSNIVDVGDSGSVLYFFAPVAATLPGWSVFTGDESIRKRPVSHLVDALRQLGAEAYISRPDVDAPPLIIHGPIKPSTVHTGGELSQYISGIMIAAARMNGTTTLKLSNPKEVPYLQMTCDWLSFLGIPVEHDEAFFYIKVYGPHVFPNFEKTIPSDWEAVAFPLVAAVITQSTIVINNIDYSGSQGDDAIVAILRNMGASITEDKQNCTLIVNSTALCCPNLRGVTVNCSGFPDAVPALCVAACCAHGVTRLEDIAVCRRKETDRISLMASELTKLGATVVEGPDFIEIHGNGVEVLHGGEVQSMGDHRVAMAFSVLGLALPRGESITIYEAECCAVSFPDFYNTMNTIGAGFLEC